MILLETVGYLSPELHNLTLKSGPSDGFCFWFCFPIEISICSELQVIEDLLSVHVQIPWQMFTDPFKMAVRKVWSHNFSALTV